MSVYPLKVVNGSQNVKMYGGYVEPKTSPLAKRGNWVRIGCRMRQNISTPPILDLMISTT